MVYYILCLQFSGVGGFIARKIKYNKMDDAGINKDMGNEEAASSDSLLSIDEKPRKKKPYRKPKSKLSECYPPYLRVISFVCRKLYTKHFFQRII